MTAELKILDLSKTLIKIGIIDPIGLAKGDSWNIDKPAPDFTDKLGLRGSIVPIMSYDNRAILTLRIMKTSPANGELTVLRTTDASTGKGVVPIIISDPLTGEKYYSSSSRIKSMPKVGASGPYIWRFIMYRLLPVFGEIKW